MDYHYHFRSFKGKWAKHPGFSTLLDCHKVEDTIPWSWLSQRNFIWDPWLQIFFLFRKIVVKMKSQTRCWLNNGGRHVCHSGMLFGGCSTIYTIYTILFIKKRKKNSLWWFDLSKSRSVRLKRHRKKIVFTILQVSIAQNEAGGSEGAIVVKHPGNFIICLTDSQRVFIIWLTQPL